MGECWWRMVVFTFECYETLKHPNRMNKIKKIKLYHDLSPSSTVDNLVKFFHESFHSTLFLLLFVTK